MTILDEREYRIFLSAMSREEKVCRLLDDKDGYQNKGIKFIDPEMGEWEEVFDYRYKYCPNCGSQMNIGRD